MALFPDYTYCIDTSVLIELKIRYPRNTFPSLWEKIGKLIEQGRIIAPRAVFDELVQYEDRNDELFKWVKRFKKMFKDLDSSQLQEVKKILIDHPDLVDKDKQTEDADPFIIALAIIEGCSVITQESQIKVNRIPYVCRKYKIKCISLVEFFSERKWKF
jgi:predicted nucleic acid-binding protein